MHGLIFKISSYIVQWESTENFGDVIVFSKTEEPQETDVRFSILTGKQLFNKELKNYCAIPDNVLKTTQTMFKIPYTIGSVSQSIWQSAIFKINNNHNENTHHQEIPIDTPIIVFKPRKKPGKKKAGE